MRRQLARFDNDGGTNLKINHDFAERFAEEPGLGDVPYDGRWQAEQYHKEVSHSEVNDEDVRHSSHRMVRVNSQADECIADLQEKICDVLFTHSINQIRRGAGSSLSLVVNCWSMR